jgi:hypothetical protein
VSDLTPEEQELLSTFREEWGPTKETKDAVRAAIPDALRATPESSPEGGGAGGLSRSVWAGAGLAVIGLCAVGLVWLRSDVPANSSASERVVATSAAPVTTPAPPVPAPFAQPAPQTEAVSLDSLPNAPPQDPPGTRATAQPALGARPAPSAEPASGDTLAEELALLRAAQNALRSGAPDEALAALSKHATRFPTGVLREERMTLQVLALCDRGDVAAARAAKADLEKVAPGSSHLQRLTTSCAAR